MKNFLEEDNDDEDESTPIDGTGAYPIFRQAAKELSVKLEALKTSEARLMAGEIRWFEETFAAWSPYNRPSEHDRKRLVDEFLELHRKYMNYIKK